MSPSMQVREEHRRILEHRLKDDEAVKEIEAAVETQRQVSKERTKLSEQTRYIKIFSLLYDVTAKEVAEFFTRAFGSSMHVLDVTLNKRLGVNDGSNDGSGIVKFASSETYDLLREHCSTDARNRQWLHAAIGHRGRLIFHRHYKSPEQERLEGSKQLFTSKCIELGNKLSHKAVVFDDKICTTSDTVEVRCNAQGLVWEFQQGNNRYRFEVAYRHVWGKAGIQSLQGGRAALLLNLRQPPRIFRYPLSKGGAESGELSSSWQNDSAERMEWQDDPEKWMRTTDFTPNESIGSCYLYRFVLPYTVEEILGTQLRVLEPLLKVGILERRPDIVEVPAESWSDAVLVEERLNSLPYNVRYYLECLVSTGLICKQHVNDKLLDTLEAKMPEEVVIRALSLMLAGRKKVAEPARQLRDLIVETIHDTAAMHDLSRPLEEYCMLVARVLVTPTRIVRLPPEVELSNRVLRQYKDHTDRFIRISFGEENSGILHLGPRVANSRDLILRMEDILKNGIEVAGRRFELLAFSTSQLKEQSVWAIAPLPALSADDVRRWMGDFENIRCVAKYAARMGQCFSSTLDTVDVKAHEVLDIPDVERNEYVFSDGCGLISPELADLVAAKLRQQRRIPSQAQTDPCAYQLRYGGCKGVVVKYPSLPPLQGRKMLVRRSMRKFEARSQRIEVVGISRYLPAFLNRQIISILFQKSLGVPNSAFQDLQDSMLETLNRMLHDSDTALHVLADYASIDNQELVSSLMSIISAGFDIKKEPYVQGILAAIRCFLLKDLKNKTRIFVPEAALLIGVMDEIGVLEYGQVFIQIDRSPELNTPELILGDVFVAKNPCFHPGDVRFLKAVRAPALEHLKNVVVFPQKGHRPHPNEISGSDLDGDNYFCCWRQSLIPSCRDIQAMEFPAAEPKELDQAVTIKDVADFFVDHAVSDNLGIIANAHLAMADASEDGVFNERCLKLADLHSKAVDFPKTGVLVEIPRELRPMKFPDFMQKEHGQSYPSQTIIGRLFHEIQDPPSRKPDSESRARALDEDLLVDGYQEYVESAQAHLYDYEQLLIIIMHQFNVYDEFQLVTGCIVDWDHMRRRRKGKQYDAKTHVLEAVQALRKKFLRIFEEEFRDESEDITAAEGLLKKASAWYYVTYQQQATRKPWLCSFAWVVDKYLIQIKCQASSKG